MTGTVMLADDHAVVRDGLRALLEVGDLQVVAVAGNGREAVAEAQRLRPDIVIMDIADLIAANRVLLEDIRARQFAESLRAMDAVAGDEVLRPLPRGRNPDATSDQSPLINPPAKIGIASC